MFRNCRRLWGFRVAGIVYGARFPFMFLSFLCLWSSDLVGSILLAAWLARLLLGARDQILRAESRMCRPGVCGRVWL